MRLMAVIIMQELKINTGVTVGRSSRFGVPVSGNMSPSGS
jgi:hypothetical protein